MKYGPGNSKMNFVNYASLWKMAVNVSDVLLISVICEEKQPVQVELYSRKTDGQRLDSSNTKTDPSSVITIRIRHPDENTCRAEE